MTVLRALQEWVNTRFGRGGVPSQAFKPWELASTQDPMWLNRKRCVHAQGLVSAQRSVARHWDWDRTALTDPGFSGQTWAVGPGDALKTHRVFSADFASAPNSTPAAVSSAGI